MRVRYSDRFLQKECFEELVYYFALFLREILFQFMILTDDFCVSIEKTKNEFETTANSAKVWHRV